MTEITEEIIEVQGDAKNDDKKWCVYCHTNKTNGKKYFGITSRQPEERWKNGNGYKRDQAYFYRAICKYTWDGFEHEIIADCLTENEAKEKEIELIALFKTNCRKYYNPTYGYNMTDGGDGSCGRFLTNETRAKISKALVGREMSTDTRLKMSESRKGMRFTKEHKANISQSQKGKVVSDETRQKISASKLGKFTGVNNPNYGNNKLAGDKNPNYGRNGSLHPGYGRKHTENELQKMKLANSGDKNPMYGKFGIDNPHTLLVYCIELNQIFCGASDAERLVHIAHQSIAKCCKGKRNYAGKHPITNAPLHWHYVYDQPQKDGSVIYGAITLKYITDAQANQYLNSLKEKGNE